MNNNKTWVQSTYKNTIIYKITEARGEDDGQLSIIFPARIIVDPRNNYLSSEHMYSSQW